MNFDISTAFLCDDYFRIIHPTGPFDGGCLVTALALRNVIGGHLYALTFENLVVQHCVIKNAGPADWLVDGSGFRSTPDMFAFHQNVEHHQYCGLIPTHEWIAKFFCTYDFGFSLGPGDIVVDQLTQHFHSCWRTGLLLVPDSWAYELAV